MWLTLWDVCPAHLEQFAHRTQRPDEDVSFSWRPQASSPDSHASAAAWIQMEMFMYKCVNVWGIYSKYSKHTISIYLASTFSMRISLSAIFLITGSSSDSTNFLMATIWPVSLCLHLNTTPYEPSPILASFSYLSISQRAWRVTYCKRTSTHSHAVWCGTTKRSKHEFKFKKKHYSIWSKV